MEKYLKGAGYFKGFPRVLQESSTGVPRNFLRCDKEVSRLFPKRFKDVLKEFFRGTRVFPGNCKNV